MKKQSDYKTPAQILFANQAIITERPINMSHEEYVEIRRTQTKLIKNLFRPPKPKNQTSFPAYQSQINKLNLVIRNINGIKTRKSGRDSG